MIAVAFFVGGVMGLLIGISFKEDHPAHGLGLYTFGVAVLGLLTIIALR